MLIDAYLSSKRAHGLSKRQSRVYFIFTYNVRRAYQRTEKLSAVLRGDAFEDT